MSEDRNRKNANFYEEDKDINTNQNDTDQKLDNENYDNAKILNSNTFPNPNLEVGEENRFDDVRRNLEFSNDLFRNKQRNLK